MAFCGLGVLSGAVFRKLRDAWAITEAVLGLAAAARDFWVGRVGTPD